MQIPGLQYTLGLEKRVFSFASSLPKRTQWMRIILVTYLLTACLIGRAVSFGLVSFWATPTHEILYKVFPFHWTEIPFGLSILFGAVDSATLFKLFHSTEPTARTKLKLFAAFGYCFTSFALFTTASVVELTLLRGECHIPQWTIISITNVTAIIAILLILRIAWADGRNYKPVLSGVAHSTTMREQCWEGRLQRTYNAECISILLPFHGYDRTQQMATVVENQQDDTETTPKTPSKLRKDMDLLREEFGIVHVTRQSDISSLMVSFFLSMVPTLTLLILQRNAVSLASICLDVILSCGVVGMNLFCYASICINKGSLKVLDQVTGALIWTYVIYGVGNFVALFVGFFSKYPNEHVVVAYACLHLVSVVMAGIGIAVVYYNDRDREGI